MINKKEQGFVLWFTGLPCSGKTTVADRVAEELKKKGRKTERLDGDIVRKSLTSDLGFSKQDRDENIKRITFVAKLLSRNGVATLVTFISPYRKKRNQARKETTNFIEVFVKCSVEECEKRDVKGMYKLARKGEIKDFTGISDPYEEPESPEIVLDTEKESVEQSAEKVLEYLQENGFIEKETVKYSKEEEERIKKRLRDLGYIE
ncbi:MAG: adenylyl-sulfate kinase [Elusimicrobiota bacterium]